MANGIMTPEDLPLEGATQVAPATDDRRRKAEKAGQVLAMFDANPADAQATFGEDYDSVRSALEALTQREAKKIAPKLSVVQLPDWKEGAVSERDEGILTPEDLPVEGSAPGARQVAKAASAAGAPQGEVTPLEESEVAGAVPSEQDVLEQKAALDKIEKEKLYQKGDAEYGTSASNVKEFYRPPQTKGSEYAPNWWPEPSVDQYHRDMAEEGMGLLTEGVTERSPAFLEYADKRWQQAYDEAEKRGIKLKRLEYSPEVHRFGDFETAKLATTPATLASAVDRGALLGAGSLVTRGLQKGADKLGVGGNYPDVIEEGKEIRGKMPTASKVAEVGSMFLPSSAANLAGRAALRLPGASRLLARSPALRGALAGASGAATQSAGTEVVDAIGEERAPRDLAGKALSAGTLGGMGGAVLGKLQGGLARGRRAISEGELSPQLGQARGIGADTSVLRGMTTPPAVRALKARARQQGKGLTEEGQLRRELEPGVARAVDEQAQTYNRAEEELSREIVDYGSEAGRRYDQVVRRAEQAVERGGNIELRDTKKVIETEKARYYKSPEGREQKSLRPLAESWKKFYNLRLDKDGRPQTTTIAKENNKYTSLAETSWDRILVADTPVEAKQIAASLGDDAVVVTPLGARKYGVNTDKLFESQYNARLIDELGLSDPAAKASYTMENKIRFEKGRGKTPRIVMLPKRMSAASVDEHLASVRRALIDESTQGAKGEVDIPRLKLVEEGGYKVRDQFDGPSWMQGVTAKVPGKTLRGWSAAQHQLSQQLRAIEDRLDYAGMPRTGTSTVAGERIPAKVQQKIRNAVESTGTGRNPVAEEAVHRLARSGHGESSLSEMGRLRAEAQDIGTKIPMPEEITKAEVDAIRNRLGEYSQGRPNESLERVMQGRQLYPRLRLLPEARSRMAELGMKPETSAEPSKVKGLLQEYRSGTQPGPTEEAFERLMRGRPEESQLKLLRGLKALNELKRAGKLNPIGRITSGGDSGPRMYSSLAPQGTPLKLRLDALMRHGTNLGPGGAGAAQAELSTTRKEPSKLKPGERRQLLNLRRSLQPGAL